MKSITIVSLVATLASISVQALPVRVDDAAKCGSQVIPNGLSQLVEREDDPYNGIPETNSLESEYYEDGRPKDPNAAPPADDSQTPEAPAQNPPDATPEPTESITDVSSEVPSALGAFIGAAAAQMTTAAASDERSLNAYDVLSAAAATFTR